MAKRARGTKIRPGQRTALQRPATRPTATPAAQPTSAAASPAPRAPGLTADEEARAAVLEARIMEEERAAEDGRRRVEQRRRGPVETEGEVRRSPGGLGRGSQEYAYVGRDVRRITLLGGSLMGILVVLWVVAQATGSGSL